MWFYRYVIFLFCNVNVVMVLLNIFEVVLDKMFMVVENRRIVFRYFFLMLVIYYFKYRIFI